MLGSEHNDEFYMDGGRVRTRTNRSGGVQGGISNGENIVLRVAFKPTSTITIQQRTVTREGAETDLRARGRHDPCVVPRAVRQPFCVSLSCFGEGGKRKWGLMALLLFCAPALTPLLSRSAPVESLLQVPMVEAMVALTLADHLLRHHAQ